jgi:adenosylcobinamide kinase / adenosylcobinamide-phosphate guanylyltransferase
VVPQDRFILVTGGARSGKSTYAERLAAQLAEPCGGRVTYLATSQTHDAEMAARVAAHRAARPAAWTTVECPLEVPAAIREQAGATAKAGSAASGGPAGPPVFLLDCVTFWITNLLFAGGAFGGSAPPDDGYNYDKDLLPAAEERAATARVAGAVDDLFAALGETGATLVAVTNEVGLGVVPEYPLARLYRDQLGWANQRLARAADRVYLLVSGYPLDIKALAAPLPADPSSSTEPSSPPKESS